MQTSVSTHRAANVILVAVTVYNNTSVDCRVRVQNRLNGPVLPPRQAGIPASGWDAAGYNGHVPAGKRMTIGYACPSDDNDDDDTVPSIDETVSVEAHADSIIDNTSINTSISSPTDAVIRTLGRSRPPIDTIPDSNPISRSSSDSPTDNMAETPGTDRHITSAVSASKNKQTSLPPCVDTWLTTIEGRFDQSMGSDQSVSNRTRQTRINMMNTTHAPRASSKPNKQLTEAEYEALEEINTRVDHITTASPHVADQPINALRQIATRTIDTSSSSGASDMQHMEASVADDSKATCQSRSNSEKHTDINSAPDRIQSADGSL
ncbi:hypothetical protein [Haloquadratum walsbyi]|uniref:DUF7857 domain-containing protein n=1 Tax=Haloquadratum walsbyi TaxID=293091 RepID=UPI0015F6B0D2|nr:hypothetical protein [Haloquadratum walsbyi]